MFKRAMRGGLSAAMTAYLSTSRTENSNTEVWQGNKYGAISTKRKSNIWGTWNTKNLHCPFQYTKADEMQQLDLYSRVCIE